MAIALLAANNWNWFALQVILSLRILYLAPDKPTWQLENHHLQSTIHLEMVHCPIHSSSIAMQNLCVVHAKQIESWDACTFRSVNHSMDSLWYWEKVALLAFDPRAIPRWWKKLSRSVRWWIRKSNQRTHDKLLRDSNMLPQSTITKLLKLCSYDVYLGNHLLGVNEKNTPWTLRFSKVAFPCRWFILPLRVVQL